MVSFFDLDLDALKQFCLEHKLPAFASAQIQQWVYQHGVVNPDQMTNVSKKHRDILREHLQFCRGSINQAHIASDDTEKLLVDWPTSTPPSDASALSVLSNQAVPQTECVMIPTPQRKTACISSQVGCPVGCRFCASGLGGLEHNLTAGQIVEQIHHLQSQPTIDRITNVVFMGMGEPLANMREVMAAIRTLNAPWGYGISARKITVSTVGLPTAIRRFATFELPVTLALSLHAPNDTLRKELIPWSEYAPIEELLDACDEYFQQSGREITLEYLLLRDVNDRVEHAKELATIAKRIRAKHQSHPLQTKSKACRTTAQPPKMSAPFKIHCERTT